MELEELARWLGTTKSHDLSQLIARTIRTTTSVFHWKYLSESLTFPDELQVECYLFDGKVPRNAHDLLSALQRAGQRDNPPDPVEPTYPIDWTPPDLSEGCVWYRERVQNLRHACEAYGDESARLFSDGLEILRRHRENYDDEGPRPTKLQSLWWEFPPEH